MNPQLSTTQQIERDVLARMLKGDLDLVATFADLNHISAARRHLASAAIKLDQLAKLLECAAPAALSVPSQSVITV